MLPFLCEPDGGALPGYTDIPPMRVALLPFEDRAGFQGEWELARDVPELLGVHLSALPGISVASTDALQEADDLKQVKTYPAWEKMEVYCACARRGRADPRSHQ